MLRSEILRGPAIIQFNGESFYSKDDITVELVQTTIPVVVANFGKVGERVDMNYHRITFTPAGQWTALSVLFPYATATIGQSVFGTDEPLTIWTTDGRKRVYTAAAITKMPDISLASNKTLLGQVEFTCIYGESASVSDAGSLFVDSSESYPGDADFDSAEIIMQPYTLSWKGALNFTVNASTDVLTATAHRYHNGMRVRVSSGGTLPAGLAANTDYFVVSANRTAGTLKLSATLGGAAINITDTGSGTHAITPRVWSSFNSKDGVTVSFNLSLTDETNDVQGMFDKTFQSLEVSAKLIPEAAGILPSDITAARLEQGSGAVRGRALEDAGADLLISGTGVYVQLSNAVIGPAQEKYGASVRRVGETQFNATRTITAGVADALFYVGTSAPA